MTANNDVMSLSALLGASLDDLPDMPAFVTWPDGAYRCLVTAELKEINDAPVLEAKYTLKEVLELADPSQTPPLPGATNNEAFFLNKELGQGKLKEFLVPFATRFNEPNVQACIDLIQNIEVDVVNKARKDKEDKTKRYFTSIAIEVV